MNFLKKHAGGISLLGSMLVVGIVIGTLVQHHFYIKPAFERHKCLTEYYVTFNSKRLELRSTYGNYLSTKMNVLISDLGKEDLFKFKSPLDSLEILQKDRERMWGRVMALQKEVNELEKKEKEDDFCWIEGEELWLSY